MLRLLKPVVMRGLLKVGNGNKARKLRLAVVTWNLGGNCHLATPELIERLIYGDPPSVNPATQDPDSNHVRDPSLAVDLVVLNLQEGCVELKGPDCAKFWMSKIPGRRSEFTKGVRKKAQRFIENCEEGLTQGDPEKGLFTSVRRGATTIGRTLGLFVGVFARVDDPDPEKKYPEKKDRAVVPGDRMRFRGCAALSQLSIR